MKYSGPFLPGQLRLILAIGVVYVLAWFAYYSRVPAGIYLGPEAQATLDQAIALAQGAATQAGGYSLYTYILSVFARFFEESTTLTAIARGLNGTALIIASGFAASTAGHYWRRNRNVWIAGLLIGLNPVLLFWSGQVSPCLITTAIVSAALWRIMRWLRSPRRLDTLWIGVLLALATLFETALIPFALAWPLLAFVYTHRKRTQHLTYALIFPALTFAALLVSNLQLHSPLAIQLDGFGVGVYDALSNHEAHDGKSWGLYRQLHSLLWINPIHWGLLFILTGAGIYARLKDGHRGNSVLFCIGTLGLFAVSYALFDGASQMRATILPLLAVYASGVTLLPKIWQHGSRPTRRKIIIGGALLALFVYSPHLGYRTHQTWESDYVFLAKANVELANNERAKTWAEKALELNPEREDMRRVLVMADFNEWALGDQTRTLPIETAREYLARTYGSAPNTEVEVIRGIYYYKLRETERATELWLRHGDHSPLAKICLYWTATQAKPENAELKPFEGLPYYDLLEEAQKINRSDLVYHNIEKTIDNMLAFAY